MNSRSLMMTVLIAVSLMLTNCFVPVSSTESTTSGPAKATGNTSPDAGKPPPAIYGLQDSLVACSGCSNELLTAKTTGILNAMDALKAFTGTDMQLSPKPVTFHLSGDQVCGSYAQGLTGDYTDNGNQPQICLFDAEKKNRALAFTPENAVLPADQLLPAHEALHVWFHGRISDYNIQEPFCKITSFIIAGTSGIVKNETCGFFHDSPGPDRLMYDLCKLGMDTEKVSLTLKQTAAAADSAGRPLTSSEFAGLVTSVLGQDATPAFRRAALIP